MQWNIENSLVCPVTGTGFSVAASAKNLKLIIWYSGDYFLSIGSVINITQNEVFINGVPGDLQVIHAFPYTENYGQHFQRILNAPVIRTLCCSSAIEEASASSPCAPTAPGKRGRNKASPSFRASVPVLIFYVGTRCPDSPCPHCAAPCSLNAQCFCSYLNHCLAPQKIVLNRSSGNHSEFHG
ncbi:hypothetical protein NFK05_12760 [Klebsiella michiganensis]|nr:hypothetical protein [Klebsiella michiganensis]MDH1345407.1 hypothetical protein [Klebsiella michiganensis]WFX49921.1 hypothetical protein NFK05_12760 [Klebsiella michiganensis]WFX55581.1 hypothetical protein NFK06_12755 [Klebsiella michiganensis]